jgi:hypothetical protein
VKKLEITGNKRDPYYFDLTDEELNEGKTGVTKYIEDERLKKPVKIASITFDLNSCRY